MAAYVQGLDQVLFNIEREINNVKKRTLRGQIKAMKHLEKQMLTVSPKVPKRSGWLRRSWYIFPTYGPTGSIVTAGYTAPHAPAVHEMTEGFVNWREPGSGPKWLQIHFARNQREMQLIIAAEAAIKR